MALKKHPFFLGKITVTAGYNDEVEIIEDNASAPPATLNFLYVVPPGEYDVVSLLTMIQSGINGITGLQNLYNFSLSRSTGRVTILRVAGTQNWLPRVTSGTSSLLTGGQVDSYGNAVLENQRGYQGLGFAVLPPGFSVQHSYTAEYQSSGVWCPSWPPSQDTEDVLATTTVEAVAVSGESEVYSFSTPTWDSYIESAAIGGVFSGACASRTQQYELLPFAEMEHWYHRFWPEFAFAGGEFEFYEQWDQQEFRKYKLTGDSLRVNQMGVRPHGVQLYNHSVTMRPVAFTRSL